MNNSRTLVSILVPKPGKYVSECTYADNAQKARQMQLIYHHDI